MPFARPTLTQLRDGALADVVASKIYDATTNAVINPMLLQYDPLTIIAKVLAGLAYEEYGYLDWISLQATPYTATDEAVELAWGALVNIVPEPATAATGTATFGGIAGKDFPAETQLVRGDGTTYTTTADVIVPDSASVTVSFVATTPGAAGTIAAGAAISLSSPIAGINTEGVVSSSTAPGADMETLEAFKARYLARFAAPLSGGAVSDYEGWALAVPGVTRAWVVGNAMGPGTVGLYIMLDTSEAGNGGFPVGNNGVSPLDNNGSPRDTLIATGDQAAVANALIPLQPVTDLVYVSGPVPDPIPFVISNLGAGDTLANQTAIKAALAQMFLSLGDARGATIYPSSWNAAIASVPGLTQFTIASPTAPITTTVGQLPVVGELTFNA